MNRTHWSLIIAHYWAGITLSKEKLQRLAEMTAAAGTWLVFDDTYETFLYSGKPHHAVNAPNIIHVFSFSKVGILAY